MFPSPCRILKALCCCCLKKLGVQTCWAAATGVRGTGGKKYITLKQGSWFLFLLQTVQIMVGVLNIGLGPGRTSTRLGDFTSLGAAYWLGAVFIVTGIMTVLAGRFPSSCLVGFSVLLNIVGAIFSITGIVLYSIDLINSSLLWVCDRSGSDPDRYDDRCRNVAAFDQNLLTSLDRTLILLAVLLLVVSISFAALGIGFLTGEVKEEEVDNVSKEDLKEILLISPGA
ncbi:high affinity immunoglobulin epsilon receptor subunit beta-like isoform X2 [Xiphophorus maculatus]|uniref:high affinity immunoglobulin epsilon receptor subunit beta-like isoform X2 n=1 Tax=Xiphophorus maculatus TaxID=8083 RepID=UPI000C6CE4A6|nr:high affinity immunoglobulin epsilon receptor subunit beta-like isoform X2 [Xiphophorus maculatus]